MRQRLTALMAGLVTIVGMTMLSATPAAAATHVRPAIDCTQSPSTNQNLKGGKFTGSGVNIRTGPGTSCTVVGSGFPSNTITLHCAKPNGSTLWVYLKDNTTGKTGWASSAFVTWPGLLIGC